MSVEHLDIGQPRAGSRKDGAVSRTVASRSAGLVAVFLCLGATLGAQWLLDGHAETARWAPLAAGSLYLLAAALWVARTRALALEAPATAAVESPSGVAWRRFWPALGLLAAAILLGALAAPRFAGNQFSRDGTLLWGLGLLSLAAVAWLGSIYRGKQAARPTVPTLADRQGLRLSWYQVGLLLVLAVGAFYRFFRINVIPLEMGPDLPHNYNNIRQILMGEYPIFFPSHPGREGLFFYLAAPFCRLFGLNHTNIKVAASLIGLATLPVVYLLGEELYDREVGLYAALFLGISRWHIILGRFGYRATLVPLMIALTWYFLVRGLRAGRATSYALSGLFLGLGMYTYNAFMVAPLVVLAVLVVQFLVGRGRRVLAHAPQILLLFLVAVYVFIPLGRFAMEQPDIYGYRAATRVTSLEKALPDHIVSVFFSNVAKALLMFNVRGDAVSVANVPFERQLGFISASLFVLGLAYVLWRWRAGQNVTVPVVGMGLLMPSAMALAFPNEVPNAIRAIGVLPAAVLLCAVALAALRRQMSILVAAGPIQGLNLSPASTDCRASAGREPVARAARALLIVAAVAALGVETWAVYPFYFRDYVRHLPDLNYSISLQMARAIDAFADDGESFIKIMPYWYDGNAVRAQLRRADPEWHNELDALEPDKPPLAGPTGRYMVILHPDDQGTLRMLRQAFPRGIALVNLDYAGKIAFITFYGER